MFVVVQQWHLDLSCSILLGAPDLHAALTIRPVATMSHSEGT
jgi:hypothetical protein